MRENFKKKCKHIALISKRYFLSANEKLRLSKISSSHYLTSRKSSPTVVVQCVEDYYYCGLFAELVLALKRSTGINVDQVVIRNLRPGASLSLRSYISSLLFSNFLTDSKWVRIYASFCDRVAYRQSGAFFTIRDIVDLKKAFLIWRGLKCKEDVLLLTIDGVVVGDLIYDSYLRYKPAPTINIVDIYLLMIIWQAIRCVRMAKYYFSKNNPKLFLTSYASYIQHGIPVRVALMKGVSVFSLGNYQEFVKKLELEDWLHTRNHTSYYKDWLALNGQDEKLQLANLALSKRLAGGVDAATYYMQRSAYEDTGEAIPDVSGGLVIFLHDFFDSPHCYRWMLFPDFLEWIEYTLGLAQQHNLKIFVKPHPNQLPESAIVVKELMIKYPEVCFLSSRVTNTQLVGAGMSCALTVYGTVAHEMAFLGMPVITCGDHPHSDFDFCFNARNRTEYDQLILGYKLLSIDKQKMRTQSLAFYFMHSLNISSEETSLLKCVEKYRNRLESAGEFLACDEYIELLLEITSQPEFLVQVKKLKNAIKLPFDAVE